MKKIIAINRVCFYIICVLVLSTGLTSCETNDDDVSRLISGGMEGPAPEKPFAMEGTWVMGGMNSSVVLTVLGQNMDVSEAIEGMLLGVLNGALPVTFEKLSDVEVAIKIEPGEAADKVKLSSPTLDLLLGMEGLAFEMDKEDKYTLESKGTLVEVLKSIVLLNYVTEETPNGVKPIDTPLAMLADALGEKATLKTVTFECKSSELTAEAAEDTRTGEVTLTLNGKLIIDTLNGGLVGIFLKNVTTNIVLRMNLRQWTAL